MRALNLSITFSILFGLFGHPEPVGENGHRSAKPSINSIERAPSSESFTSPKFNSLVHDFSKGGPSAFKIPVTALGILNRENKDNKDNIEVGTLEWDGKKWHLNVRFGVLGAADLYYVTKADLARALKNQIELNDFLKVSDFDYSKTAENGTPPEERVGSYESLPDFKVAITNQLKAIERAMTTDWLSVKFEVFFIDEKQLIPEDDWRDTERKSISAGEVAPRLNYDHNARKSVSKDPFFPIRYSPIPVEGPNLNPANADPFVLSAYMAHEIFHALSRSPFNDGFLFSDYPYWGLMNGGEQINRLRQLGLLTRLLALEFNTLVRNQLDYFNESAQDGAKIDLHHSGPVYQNYHFGGDLFTPFDGQNPTDEYNRQLTANMALIKKAAASGLLPEVPRPPTFRNSRCQDLFGYP